MNIHDDYFLTPNQCRKVMLAAKTFRDKTIVKFLWICGIRREEVCNARIEDIRWDQRLIKIWGKRTKANPTGERFVPLTTELLQDFKILAGSEGRGPLFPTRYKGQKKHMTPRNLNTLIENLGIKAGIKNPEDPDKPIHPHLFRHSFVHNNRNEMGLENVSKIIGHENFKFTLKRYGRGITKAQEAFDKVMEK